MSARPRIVVLGIFTQMPVAGPAWEVLQYVLGFERLGYETYYVEDHRQTPRPFITTPDADGPALAAAFISSIAASAASSPSNANTPSPVGSQRPKPVSCAMTGRPEAR